MPEIKLTESADERKFRSFFSKNAIYHVPLFQRAYRWMPAKLKQFQTDLLATMDSDDDDLHFMGALIIHRNSGNFRDIDEYEIIDGQQRITTIFLHIAAAVYVLSESENGGPEAWRLLYNYLINNEFFSQSPASLKLHPSRNDREPVNDVMKKVLGSHGVKEAAPAGIQIAYLSMGTPSPSNRVEKNFNDAVKFFKNQHRENGNQRVVDLVETILNQMTVVVIEVVDPLSGPKIFDSLNSSQEPMTVGDLVRNDVFARVSETGPAIEVVESEHWHPFFNDFGSPSDGHFENFFFPYGLISIPNAKKADVYRLLRERWSNPDLRLDSVQVIKELRKYQPDYMMMRLGKPLPEHTTDVRFAFRRLFLMESPKALYPFVMQLSNGVRESSFNPDECIKILDVIDSFLTRRATVGQEPTGLHAVFKRLWNDAVAENGVVTAAGVRKIISQGKTVQWPDDEEFAKAIKVRRLYGVKVTPYLLGELNQALGGDAPDEKFWVEHVLPQSPDEGWDGFDDEARKRVTDRLANLLPLSEEMNRILGNNAYSIKRQRYEADSKFKMAREFARDNSEWTPEALESRADWLAELAVKRWPFGPVLG